MTQAASQGLAIAQSLQRLMDQDRGRLLSALVARVRDLQLAEDALQEATLSALSHWGRAGMPQSPQGWLLRVALRKAIDRIRQNTRSTRNASELAILAEEEACEMDPALIPDERLRLIFTCCHPALEAKSRVALTLRTLCGLTTAQVAAVYLDSESTMGQRLSRAKAKISAARIPFSVPGPEDLPDRVNSVLTVVYLVFTAGYTSSPDLGRDLCEEAIFLARLLDSLCPQDPEIEGCLALLRLTHARVAARIDADGCVVPPAEQDKTLWDQAALAEGRALLDGAISRNRPGPFQIKAAIAACHALPQGPDWPQIAALYEALLRWEPSPIVALGQIVARMEAGDVSMAAIQIETLAKPLADYQPYHATRAEILRRLGQVTAAASAYDRAIALARRPEDAAFLRKRQSMPEH